jgi:hypothetical protein
MTEKKYISPESAIQILEEKDVTIDSLNGGTVRIRKLTFKDLGLVYAKAKDDPFQMAKWMIFAGVMEPKFSPDQIDSMKPDVATELSTKVSDYSGMTEGSVEKTKNSSTTMTEATQSGT